MSSSEIFDAWCGGTTCNSHTAMHAPDHRLHSLIFGLATLALVLDIAPPATASPSDMDLTTVLQTIAARSPDVLAAQAALRGAEAQVKEARAAWFGKIDTYALSQHFNDPRLVRPITQPPNVALYPFGEDQFGYGVDFQLPIDLSGEMAANVDAAHARASGAKWSAEDVRLRAVLQGAALYRDLQALAGQEQALLTQREALQRGLTVAEVGLKVGNIAKVSLLRVQAAVAEVESSLATVQGQTQKIRAQLAALMGVPNFTGAIQPLTQGPVQFPDNPDAPVPAVQAVQQAMQAAQAKVNVVRRAEYPQLAIASGWNRNAIQFDKQGVNTWQVNLVLKLNLWSGGAQRQAIFAAVAAEDEARSRLEGAQANLIAAREGGTAQWNAQQQAYHAAQSGLEAAEEGARIEQDRFRLGLGSATDLIDVEAALARARASVSTTQATWWEADDALRYAYGQPPLALQNAPTQPPSLREQR